MAIRDIFSFHATRVFKVSWLRNLFVFLSKGKVNDWKRRYISSSGPLTTKILKYVFPSAHGKGKRRIVSHEPVGSRNHEQDRLVSRLRPGKVLGDPSSGPWVAIWDRSATVASASRGVQWSWRCTFCCINWANWERARKCWNSSRADEYEFSVKNGIGMNRASLKWVREKEKRFFDWLLDFRRKMRHYKRVYTRLRYTSLENLFFLINF